MNRILAKVFICLAIGALFYAVVGKYTEQTKYYLKPNVGEADEVTYSFYLENKNEYSNEHLYEIQIFNSETGLLFAIFSTSLAIIITLLPEVVKKKNSKR